MHRDLRGFGGDRDDLTLSQQPLCVVEVLKHHLILESKELFILPSDLRQVVTCLNLDIYVSLK